MRRLAVAVAVLLVLATMAVPGRAASFADARFEAQWKAGEATLPNFYGPLVLASEGRMEAYGGTMRLVQYFDKARLELGTDGIVTSGLLATELVTGKVQTGDNTFEMRPPPAINVAGDPDRPGVKYADFTGRAASVLVGAADATGKTVAAKLGDTGGAGASALTGEPYTITAYDTPTRHNVPKAFNDLRTRVGLDTVGYAISEPFEVAAYGGAQMAQVFQRRVMTYAPNNPDAFKVEFGNIGQHYYRWRYEMPAAPTVAPMPPATPAPTVAEIGATAIHPTNATTYRDPRGRFSLSYPAGWGVGASDRAEVVVRGPGTCFVEVQVRPQSRAGSLDAELQAWRDTDTPNGGGGPTQAVNVGGALGLMFSYRVATGATATYGFNAVAEYGGGLWLVAHQQTGATGDTCTADARAMLASFRFTGGAAPPPDYAATSQAITARGNATVTAIVSNGNITATAIGAKYDATGTAIRGQYEATRNAPTATPIPRRVFVIVRTQGSFASSIPGVVTAETVPSASCTLELEPINGGWPVPAGDGTVKADASGKASWRIFWPSPANARGRAVVTCTADGRQATDSAMFTVKPY